VVEIGLFRLEDGHGSDVLHPGPRACSHWGSGDRLRGMAVSAILARAAERAVDHPGGTGALQPVRWTLDLLRPASAAPCAVTANVVRQGRRLCLVDAFLHQQDVFVARGSALFLAAGGPSRGKVWSPDTKLSTPPPELRSSTTEPRLYYSEGIGWTGSPAPHQNSARKMTWHFPDVIVPGEQSTPFQQVAMVADIVNIVSNWGDSGLEFINADLTLALARLPGDDGEIGLAAEQRIEDDGVAVGSATVFDRRGVLGTVTATALPNGSNVLDPRRFGTEDDEAVAR
jgi:acyl-coenzyme A thioesterase PaaI-like protein